MMSNNMEQLNKIMTVKPSLRQIMPKWLKQVVERRTFQAALTRAFVTWAPSNWEWVDYSFNEYFLTHQVVPYLIHCRKEAIRPDPTELANLWAEQFTWFDQEMRQRHVVQLMPAVTNFLSFLEAELRVDTE
jgi:hypothetical protein